MGKCLKPEVSHSDLLIINLEPMNARCSISDAADTKIEVEKKTGETYKFSAILPH